MQQVDNQAGSPSHESSHSFRRVACSYLLKEWPSAVLVAAVVFIIHHKSDWLDAVDGYAFVAIGNLGFHAEPVQAEQVLALLIDSATHESRYLERSPLSRCELHRDLQRLYAAGPDIVAIDIDISPAVWSLDQPKLLEGECLTGQSHRANKPPRHDEAVCEDNLYSMIESSRNTTTIIIEPFPVSEPEGELGRRKNCWRERMKKTQRVEFGDAKLSVDYGLVIKHHAADNSFVSLARALTPRTEKKPERSEKPRHIDTRQYARVKPLTLEELDSQLNPIEHLRGILTKMNGGSTEHPKKVAFFGGAYGKDDLFMTPIGKVYGVEAQAASYLSDGLKEHPGRDLLVDIVFAISFGTVVAYFWTKYFSSRFSSSAERRQSARLWIVLLIAAVVFMGFFTTVFSLRLLSWFGIWSSPIPIAVGMLIDSFVSGSIDQAIHSSEHDKQRLIVNLKALVTEPTVQHWLEKESKQRSHDPTNLRDSLTRIFGGDIYGLWRGKKFMAAGMLSVWSLAWLLLIGEALRICFIH
jgi:hypothetical protein